jgi:hypothetical protein
MWVTQVSFHPSRKLSEMDFFYMAQVEVCIIMLEPMYYAFKNCSF